MKSTSIQERKQIYGSKFLKIIVVCSLFSKNGFWLKLTVDNRFFVITEITSLNVKL